MGFSHTLKRLHEQELSGPLLPSSSRVSLLSAPTGASPAQEESDPLEKCRYLSAGVHVSLYGPAQVCTDPHVCAWTYMCVYMDLYVSVFMDLHCVHGPITCVHASMCLWTYICVCVCVHGPNMCVHGPSVSLWVHGPTCAYVL